VFNRFSKPKEPKQPLQTIDLSEDTEENQQQSQATSRYALGAVRKDFFKKPQAYIDLSDDEDQIASFSQNQILSSTAFKSKDRNSIYTSSVPSPINQTKRSETSVLPEIKPINSLQEKQSRIGACKSDAIESIVRKFNESREFKDRAILEEKIK
jgi:hypothetical protein